MIFFPPRKGFFRKFFTMRNSGSTRKKTDQGEGEKKKKVERRIEIDMMKSFHGRIHHAM